MSGNTHILPSSARYLLDLTHAVAESFGRVPRPRVAKAKNGASVDQEQTEKSVTTPFIMQHMAATENETLLLSRPPSIAVVLVSCLGLTSCGGDSTSPRVPSQSIPWTDNDTAAEIADHWHRTRVNKAVIDALSLDAPTSSNPSASMPRAAPLAPDATTAPPLRNVDPADIAVLGAVDGITVGRWTDGPADTLPVHIAWDQAPDFVRSITARAARNIGRNLQPNSDSHTLSIIVTPPVEGRPPTGGPVEYTYSNGKFQTHVGQINFGPGHYASIDFAASTSYVATHEIMHALGVLALEAYYDEANFDQAYYNATGYATDHPYVDMATGTWNGPNAVAVHGGPVPYLRTPEGYTDYGHFGIEACPTVVSFFDGCAGPDWYATVQTTTPSRLDLAYLADLGYRVLDAQTAAAVEIYGFGAWNSDAAWGVTVARDLEAHPLPDLSLPYTDAPYFNDRVAATADAFGVAPTLPFADAYRDTLGQATWNGILLGVDIADPTLAPVTGHASLAVNLETLDGYANFQNLTVLERGTLQPFRSAALSYGVTVSGNVFHDADGLIHGQWYGTDYTTVAGILNDMDPAVNLLAGFGGSK